MIETPTETPLEKIIRKIRQRIENGLCPNGCGSMAFTKQHDKQCPTCKTKVVGRTIVRSFTSRVAPKSPYYEAKKRKVGRPSKHTN